MTTAAEALIAKSSAASGSSAGVHLLSPFAGSGGGTVFIGNARVLVTLDQLKTALGIVDDTHDQYLTNQIIATTEIIERYCGRTFEAPSSALEEHDVNRDGVIVLDREKVTEVTNVYDMSGNVIDPNEYRVFKDTGIIQDRDGYASIRSSAWITVEYTAGEDVVPMAIQQVCIDYCKNRYYQKDAQNVSGISSAVSKETVEGVGSIENSNFQDARSHYMAQYGSFDIMEYSAVLDLYRDHSTLIPTLDHDVDSLFSV